MQGRPSWTGLETSPKLAFPKVSGPLIQVGWWPNATVAPVASVGKKRKKGRNRRPRQRRSGAREPVGGARLREPAAPEPAAPEPPPLAALSAALLGESAEDDLRILAELEALESLEPHSSDELADEATVTIIERTTPFDVPPPLNADSVLPEPAGEAPFRAPHVDALRHAAYPGLIEEAVVEIYEVPPSPPVSSPSRPKKRGRRGARRVFEPFTDGGSG